MSAAIYAAMGIDRTRFAELLYEHEGFVDHANDRHAPDREVPQWIATELAARIHCGDCTGIPTSCMLCHAEMALNQADELMAMIGRAAVPQADAQTPSPASQDNPQ